MSLFNSNLNSNLATKAEILWENPFGSQRAIGAETISLDLSKYDTVIVRFNEYPNRRLFPDSYGISFKNHNTYAGWSINSYSPNNNGNGGGGKRNFTVSDNGVTFSSGYFNGSVNNNSCVPNQILGINTGIFD